MRAGDAGGVLSVYTEGIATGHATFETEPPDWSGFDRARLASPRLVAEDGGRIIGWAVLSGVSSRCCYAGVAESTLYVGAAARGQGVGQALLSALIGEAEAAGFWTLNAGIFPENTASIRLHEACGYRIVGQQSRVGKMRHGPMAGQWRDVVLMERRSETVGVD
tara:strand:+ start:9987 stop:10478 length:492 start_codon:yes stop_codon:yes gene_type:complete